jgi:uncharacterized membrane protein YgcG
MRLRPAHILTIVLALHAPSFAVWADQFETDVVDRSGILTGPQRQFLLSRVGDFENATELDLAILVEQDFPIDFGSNKFSSYGDYVFAEWRKGNAGDRPLALVLNLTSKQISYETIDWIAAEKGDAIGDIFETVFIPEARRGQIAAGLEKTVAALQATLADLPAAPVATVSVPFNSAFAENVLEHVLAHELAHALIREFTLPVLANEEAMADSFATLWIVETRREDAPEIIVDRVKSWILEDRERGGVGYDFKGEHLVDLRRAYQTACLFYGSDPAEWAHIIEWLEFSESDLADCSDTAPDQRAGWLSVLEPHLHGGGKRSQNVSVIYGQGPMADTMRDSGVIERFAADVRRFDWPHPVTIHFDHCDDGAYWSRTKRTIVLCDDYVGRFITQGEQIQDTDLAE